MSQKPRWSRRAVLQSLGCAAGAATTGFPRHARARDQSKRGEISELLETFYDETDVRPEQIWMNREDVLYHDMDMPAAVAASPEYCAFLRDAIWVFNRGTQWVRESGTIICHDRGGDMLLTGTRQASAWHTGPDNTLVDDGDFTVFSKASDRRRDGAVLPSFQFRLDQHPVLSVEVSEASVPWQFCIALKGRGGRPLVASAWHEGPAAITVDIAQELAGRGFEWSYPELHFILGTWNQDGASKARVRFSVKFAGRPALAPCLPVIRTRQRASEGVPVTAMVLDAAGRPLGADQVHVTAALSDGDVALKESNGIWQTQIKGLPVGDHRILVRAQGALSLERAVQIRITDGDFLGFSRTQPFVTRRGEPIGPLNGSFQGTFFFRRAGESAERMVQGQRAWDAWDRSSPDSEHMHFWESLTEDELDERFRFLKESAFDLTTLHSHWGDWERLDAGGRIAPHGAEQLARYLRIAGRYGLRHIQALASGPYGIASQKPEYGGTVPYSRYLDGGFETSQFMNPGSAFDGLYHQYLTDFASQFADETAIFALTSAGEGDHYVGPARTNDTMRTVQAIDKNHVFLAETVLIMKKLPREHSRGFEQARFGSRTYFVGMHYVPEADLGVHFKFLSMDSLYLAEGSWSTMPSYVRFHYDVLKDDNGSPKCWTGTEHYRTRLRDTLYLGLVHRLPIINTWDEEFTEDEHRLFAEIRGLIDWRQRFANPALAVSVNNESTDADGPRYGALIDYEIALSRLGIAYRLWADSDPRPAGVNLVLGGKQPSTDLRFHSEGGILPDALRHSRPVTLSEGYSTSWAASEDGRTILAYVYNTTRHERQYYWLGGNLHRAPVATSLDLSLHGIAKGPSRARIYDLNSRQLVEDIPLTMTQRVGFGQTHHDYFVVVTPA
jgi:hypothetical protein